MEMTIKNLKKSHSESNPFIFDNTLKAIYPDITGNTSNFIDDYQSNFTLFDQYFIHEFGLRVYEDEDSESVSDLLTAWHNEVNSTGIIYLDAWARLYYALSLSYNPLYNVDGVTETVVGAKGGSNTKGSETDTLNYAAKGGSNTYAAHLDTQTNYDMAYDSNSERETSKSTSDNPQRVDSWTEDTREDSVTNGERIDSWSEDERTETVTKTGNIGVTMSQQMLNAEWEFRQKAFFKNIFKTLVEEIGLFWEV